MVKERKMRVLMMIRIPHEEFNAALRDGTAGFKLNRILERTKPESVYFTEQDGHRGAVMVVDVPNASAIPALSEPWFLMFRADVHFQIAMTPKDLEQAGLAELAGKWG